MDSSFNYLSHKSLKSSNYRVIRAVQQLKWVAHPKGRAVIMTSQKKMPKNASLVPGGF